MSGFSFYVLKKTIDALIGNRCLDCQSTLAIDALIANPPWQSMLGYSANAAGIP